MDKITESLMKGRFFESLQVTDTTVADGEGFPISFSESAKTDELPKKLIVTVEAIHAGMTKNRTFYPADNLEQSVESWLNPYEKPVLTHHNSYDGEPTGRVIAAEYKAQSLFKPETATIQLTLEITSPDAIQKVLDKRYMTLSIGGSTSKATCSICGKNLVEEGWCGHSKGRKYDGKEAYWIIGLMEFDEISWVNVPADSNAKVVSIKQPEKTSEGRRNESVENVNLGLDDIDAVIAESAEGGADPTPAAPTEGTEQTPADPAAPAEGTEGTEENPEAPAESNTKTPEELLQEAQAQIDALTKERDDALTENTNLASENDTLKAEKTTLETQVNEMTSELTQTKAERDTFRDRNIKLAKTAQRIMAERAADLRIVLGESKKEDREAILTEYAATPARMLEATIQGLLEKPAVKPRETTTVHNPGLAVPSAHAADENGEVSESASGQPEKQELTIDDLANRAVGFIMKKTRI